eukprot:s6661_g1.t1
MQEAKRSSARKLVRKNMGRFVCGARGCLLVVEPELLMLLHRSCFQCCEEITRRTGNAKKFDVFVRMLLSALAQESDSVYLDVLTARDLEMLRRHANPEAPPAAPATMQPDKRYMILTYRAEFDKVHYPLPLALDERSEEALGFVA